MNCTSCGKTLKPNLRFCTGCGSKICATCGKALKPNQRFCKGCGSDATAAAAQPAPAPPVPAKPPVEVSVQSTPAESSVEFDVPSTPFTPAPVTPAVTADKKICASCGHTLETSSRFCNVCGTTVAVAPVSIPEPASIVDEAGIDIPSSPFEFPSPDIPTSSPVVADKKLCPTCGNTINANARLCNSCGNVVAVALDMPITGAQFQPSPPPPPPPSTNPITNKPKPRRRPRTSSGVGCYHHPSQQAVAKCRICDKGLCKDCYDVYGVSTGEYAGKALCYDCTTELVAQNVAGVEKRRKSIRFAWKAMIVGASIGFLIGLVGLFSNPMPEGLFAFLLSIGICGSLIYILVDILDTFIFTIISWWKTRHEEGSALGAVIFFMLYSAWKIAISPVVTIYRIIKFTKEIKQCDEIIASDSRTIQEMRDYFAYTQAMEENEDIDLATLASEGSELYNNSYAQNVLSKGEQAAQAQLRQGVVQIAANGEIIRSFNEQGRRNRAA